MIVSFNIDHSDDITIFIMYGNYTIPRSIDLIDSRKRNVIKTLSFKEIVELSLRRLMLEKPQ